MSRSLGRFPRFRKGGSAVIWKLLSFAKMIRDKVLRFVVGAIVLMIGFKVVETMQLDVIAYKKREDIPLDLGERFELLNPLKRREVRRRAEEKDLSWVENEVFSS